jgi:hypothetical protein
MSYKDGLCLPKARCCRDTVYEAILALEDTGVFSWINRIDRVAERVTSVWTLDLPDRPALQCLSVPRPPRLRRVPESVQRFF